MGECFNIKIFDTDNPDLETIIEKCSKNGAVLSWQGGDEKDTPIVGSNLSFNMLDEKFEDGRFFELYTGNESRYKIEVFKKQIQNNEIIDILFWKGFLLPEQYNEPFQNGQFFVSFLATCGLGRLRGKYLDDSYYSEEYSVINFISSCLRLTSNTADLYFSPAITNPNARFDKIFIDGNTFTDSSKKYDAYRILETICGDLLCSVFMEYGNWFVVGYNKKAINKINYQVFDSLGVYLYDKLITKKPIDVKKKAIGRPQISVISPLKNINVVHPLALTEIPENVYKESRDGWLVINESLVEYLPRNLFLSVIPNINWVFIDYDTGKLTLKGFEPLDDSQYLYLKNKIYVTKGQKINLSVEFFINKNEEESLSDEQLVQSGQWLGLISVSVVIDDFNGNLQRIDRTYDFKADKTASDSEDFIVLNNGFLDIRLYKPVGEDDKSSIKSIRVDQISIRDIEYKENQNYQDIINDDFSIEKTVDLTLNDDIRSNRNLLSLSRQKIQDFLLYEKTIPIRSSFINDGLDYVVLDNFNIFLIVDNIDNVFTRQNNSSDWQKVNKIDVTYNFNNGDENVFTYDSESLGFVISRFDDLKVDIYDFSYSAGNRSKWIEWQDDIYQNNSKRFGRIVADIYRRMYGSVHVSLDIRLKGYYSFSSLILFGFRGDKSFYSLRTSIDLTSGNTSAKYVEAYYGADDTVLVPISVDAGLDRRIENPNIVVAQFTAIPSTPNSFLVDVQWEIVSGEGFLGPSNELPVTLYDFGRNTVLSVTIRDNYGQIASDLVEIIRVTDFSLSLNKFYDEFDTFPNTTNSNWIRRTLKYDLIINPDLLGDIMTLNHYVSATMIGALYVTNFVSIKVFKNDVEIYSKTHLRPSTGVDVYSAVVLSNNFSISIIPGDNIIYQIELAADNNDASPQGVSRLHLSEIFFRIPSGVFQNDSGNINNLPLTISEKYSNLNV
ncbi:hypothetical protein [Aquimarina sp. 2201CG14-23]|uniref:hypothetical protein n=1 Tax=Aquimarina mycalae TaxID=3040073 RepID=UPI0024780456|nr:hypothetical protein [Aquimarina sp. 2201CG14-23]MDH7444681.1 hypothetical protein [Aquimarina sp. 2201CG14-23]